MNKSIKTLFLSTSDVVGGAARASHWLARGLRMQGTHVTMGVQRKTTDYEWVWKTGQSNIDKLVDSFRTPIDTLPLRFYPKRKNLPWSLNFVRNSRLIEKINKLKPDIVNLHWVGDGFLPINQIRKIEAPIVWSLYDMWPFTGGCHYSDSCTKFHESCGSCPQLDSVTYDISRFIHERKRAHWHSVPITIVAPSTWLAGEAKKSSLFCNSRIEVIPHGTDFNVFKPINKNVARDILNLDQSRRYVLFGAMAGPSDLRKGYQYLEPALKRLGQEHGYGDLTLLVFGATEPKVPVNLGFPVKYIGRLHDDVSLAVLYSAADLTVTPSMQEAFGMTASESMACGTPVVAFGVSGPLDVIDHKVNGYLAQPFDIGDLSAGIGWILNHENSVTLREKAIEKCCDKFDLKIVSAQYLNLYADLLDR